MSPGRPIDEGPDPRFSRLGRGRASRPEPPADPLDVAEVFEHRQPPIVHSSLRAAADDAPPTLPLRGRLWSGAQGHASGAGCDVEWTDYG